MTNKELSQKIRTELKENGYSAKMVKVSVKDSLYDTVIKITIKSPEVDKRKIEKLVNKYEEIDRDERTMEILQGCNVFVSVLYDYGVFDEVSKPYMQRAAELYNNPDECVKVAEDVYLLNIDNKEIRQQKPGEHCHYFIWNVPQLAEALYKLDKFNSLVF